MFQGPEHLFKNLNKNSDSDPEYPDQSLLVDVKKHTVSLPASSQLLIEDPILQLRNKSSSLTALQRTTSYLLRFISNCKTPKSDRSIQRLSFFELQKGLNTLIKFQQRHSSAHSCDSIKITVSCEYPANLNEKFNRFRSIIAKFWNSWHNSVLNTMLQKQKWPRASTTSLSVGQVVWLKDYKSVPGCWPLGIIVSVFPDQEGTVRVVDVKTVNGVFRRAARNLILVPLKV